MIYLLLGGLFDIPKLESRIKELESKINTENFWNDYEEASRVNSEYSNLKKKVHKYNTLLEAINTLELLKDELTEDEYNKELDSIQKECTILEKETHLNGEYDNLNCYLEIHPGAGGTESCDWASMLLRMYERFCEKYNYTYEVIYEGAGEEAGIKSATILIKGENAYGY